MLSSNRLRIFPELLTLEAWRAEFDPTSNTADVFIDVSFDEARLGADESSPVRFKLSLRSAEVIFTIPLHEPLEVVRKSVARTPEGAGASGTLTVEAGSSSSGSLGTQISPRLTNLISAQREKASRESRSLSQRVEINTAFVVRHSKTSEGMHQWKVIPADGKKLIGKPWDPAVPRLALKSTKSREVLAGIARVEVRCRKEDVVVSDLVPKNNTLMDKLTRTPGKENRIAAAEAYIRTILVREGLYFENFYDPYGTVIIGDVVVEEEGDG